VCKVTFEIPRDQSNDARKACVVGEFNEWSPTATPMKRFRSGLFRLTLDLEKDRRYAFRYLLDGHRWENEMDADATLPTPYGDSVNSVIVL